jgi:hypothetical protein
MEKCNGNLKDKSGQKKKVAGHNGNTKQAPK